MPSLRTHSSTQLVKLLALGDAKTGKTGSLVSLVAAGYKLRILDFDNLLDILRYQIMKTCPDLIDNVEFYSLRDPITSGASGSKIDGKPTAWINSLKMLNHWQYDDVDLGVPATWGPDCILIVDSFTRWCDAAYNFHERITPLGKGGIQDGFAIYGNSQDDVEKQLASLTSPGFETNVIVICHGKYMDMPDGSKKIFPQGIGKALSPLIPTYFPNYVQYQNKGGRRLISLKSDSMISLSTASPDAMPESFPIETGLAEFFAVLREPPAKPKPTAHLKRVL